MLVAAHWIVGSGSLECPVEGSLGGSREARWDAGGGSHTPGSLWSLVGVGLAKKKLEVHDGRYWTRSTVAGIVCSKCCKRSGTSKEKKQEVFQVQERDFMTYSLRFESVTIETAK